MNQQEWLAEFLSLLADKGWREIFSKHGWDMSPDNICQPVTINRSEPGFYDFAADANCPITPGDPAHSLLYHALMSPAVLSESITYWPTLADIDRLENFIYGLFKLDSNTVKSLVPVVMAYEYRERSLTPHKRHADLVFSRTGVGRIGTDEPQYDGRHRCFIAHADGSGTRVQAVRYGLFLCGKATATDADLPADDNVVYLQGGVKKRDNRRSFWKPVTKLFDQQLLDNRIIYLKFKHFHQNKKLKLMVEDGGLQIGDTFDLDSPPFHYRSDRHEFVATEEHDGSIEVWRKAQTFIRMAKQNNVLVAFKVPKESYLAFYDMLERVFKFFRLKLTFRFNNRRYTSLRVGQKLDWATLDSILNGLLSLLGISERVYLSPRRSGEFTNIRHMLDDKGEIIDLNLLPVSRFKEKLRQGGYQAIMYEDPISEGYVTADVRWAGGALGEVKPAFSLMTAPDFMPLVGNVDIHKYSGNFVEGGPQALCEGRLPANLTLCDPETGKPVFSSKEDTITSIVALPRKGVRQAVAAVHAPFPMTRFLTDAASDVFAPGWDVTYSRQSLFSSPYYHTAGLGSPFLEDVKLCAAANGMWPAASPDAARTFRRVTATALPLTDQELGLSAESTLYLNTHRGTTQTAVAGWDGEYGPFIKLDADGKVCVEYASIERSDYINNYNQGKIDFSKLHVINKDEALRRLAVLALCNDWLLKGAPLKREHDFWLVSFVVVDDWRNIAPVLNIPQKVVSATDLYAAFQQSSQPDESGYLLVFAEYSKESISSDDPPLRRMQPIDRLHFVKSINSTITEPECIETLSWDASQFK